MAATERLPCPRCGTEMNRHAEKLDLSAALADPGSMDADLGGAVEEFHTCPGCRFIVQRLSGGKLPASGS